MLNFKWMFAVAVRAIVLLSAPALIVAAECAALCIAEPSVHVGTSGEQQSHHDTGSQEHHCGSPMPTDDDHSPDSPCPEHVSHVFAVDRSNVEFTPAMAAFYVLGAESMVPIPNLAFSGRPSQAHSPPGTPLPSSFATVLRI